MTDCGDTFCVIPKAHLDALIETNAKMFKDLQAKEPPKCATLEVVPKVPLDPRTNRPS